MPRSSPSKATSKKTSKSSYRGHAKAGQQDALDLIAADHKRVLQLFEEFQQMKEENDPDEEARQLLVETAGAELTVHMQMEEELFYPALREAISDMDLLDEAEVEHASAKQLITELAAMQPEDDLYDAKFTVLGEYIQHHIQEEEKKIFPKAKKSSMDLMELGEELRQRKMELREELGLDSEAALEEDEEEHASKSRKHMH